ncbi:MAG: HesA/MoeB/ThiF family protein [Gemmatimonadetes bacterium]|nr:HesA/MoeB/ThiF family protein [Gemmatimonadota bacterium]
MAAQQRLAAARVLVVGVGGLGSPAALYLAAAGVGALTLVDRDLVAMSNLHRQLLFATPDVGRPKLDVAAARLQALNPALSIATRETWLTDTNASELVAGHQVVIDATDNFPARYALNRACVAAGIPFVHGSVSRFEGQLSVLAAPGGPCYRCLFPEPPEPGSVRTCAEEGVLGVVPGVVGVLQATEAIKLLTGVGTPLVGTLLLLDLLSHATRSIRLPRRPGCPACDPDRGEPTSEAVPVVACDPAAADAAPASLPVAAPPVPPNPPRMPIDQLSPTEVAARLAADPTLTLVDVREGWEVELARVPGSVHIPLRELPGRVGELDPSRPYAMLCHHGMRSEMAASWLVAQGFRNVVNVAGGIEAWSAEVDAGIPTY